MINGLLDFSIWEMVGATLVLTHLTIISVTVFLHRHQAHRALELHPLPSHLFRFWLWLGTGIRTKDWVAIHRKHHVKCETEEDPHSPQVLGIKKVLWQGAELYREAAGVAETLDKYGKGTPDDWMERNVYRYSFAGLGLMLLADVLMFGVAGITVWAVQMIWIPVWAAGVINGIGHYWGYRNYECPDASTNIVPWGILIGGEELHNNHHTYPNSARLSSKWWEFDIGWMYIRLLQMLGLARVKKVARLPQLGQPKSALDMDSVRAVLSNRFQVMAAYSRDVILPVCRMEAERSCATSCAWLKRARKALVRNETLLDSRDQQALSHALSKSEELQLVYTFKQRLQQIWERSGSHQASPLADLQEWCRQAEAAGVAMLEQFSRRLHRYTLESSAAR